MEMKTEYYSNIIDYAWMAGIDAKMLLDGLISQNRDINFRLLFPSLLIGSGNLASSSDQSAPFVFRSIGDIWDFEDFLLSFNLECH